jgi:hypothetical protein
VGEEPHETVARRPGPLKVIKYSLVAKVVASSDTVQAKGRQMKLC